MLISYAIVGSALALGLLVSAYGKYAGTELQVNVVHRTCGVPLEWFPFLGACEIAGAAGVLGGLASPLIGIAAALGVVLYFIGAIAAHLRVGDVKGVLSPAMCLCLSAATLALAVGLRQQ